MNITLLDIGGTLLERNILFLATDQNVSANNTEGLSRSQNIEQSGLSGSTGTHKSSELTGLAVSIDLVEQLSLSARYLDRVVLQRRVPVSIATSRQTAAFRHSLDQSK